MPHVVEEVSLLVLTYELRLNRLPTCRTSIFRNHTISCPSLPSKNVAKQDKCNLGDCPECFSVGSVEFGIEGRSRKYTQPLDHIDSVDRIRIYRNIFTQQEQQAKGIATQSQGSVQLTEQQARRSVFMAP